MYVGRLPARRGYRLRGCSLGDLGDCSRPGIGKQLLTTGISTGAAVGAGAALTAAGVGAAAGPIGAAVGAVVGLVMGLFGQTSKCAKTSPDATTFLKCWGHKIPDGMIPLWSDSKCGWFDWAVCYGAQGGKAPAGGCAPTWDCKGPGSPPGCRPGPCDCSRGGCQCAPAGALEYSLAQGWVISPSGGLASGTGGGGNLQVAGMPIPLWAIILTGGGIAAVAMGR